MSDDEQTKTESLINDTCQLYISGVDPHFIFKILLENGVNPAKAQIIMRWGKVKAESLGWL
jgi:hypothetical protein